MICPICKKEFRPGPFAQHAKKHVREGKLIRREVVRPEQGNKTRGYSWSSPFVYERITA